MKQWNFFLLQTWSGVLVAIHLLPKFFTSFIVEDAFCKLCTPSLSRTICCCYSELVLLDCSSDCSSLLLVSCLLFDADIDDPPSSAMLACGFATILPLFLRGYDVVVSTRCCLSFFLCGVFHLQQMPQSRKQSKCTLLLFASIWNRKLQRCAIQGRLDYRKNRR
jgi:hypothetical protein